MYVFQSRDRPSADNKAGNIPPKHIIDLHRVSIVGFASANFVIYLYIKIFVIYNIS